MWCVCVCLAVQVKIAGNVEVKGHTTVGILSLKGYLGSNGYDLTL